jgi:REP element-mobilizing transposase RayT
MDQPGYQLDNPRRQPVLEAMLERSHDRGWQLLAAQVRSNNVHVVVEGDGEPELMMTQLKSAASRRLNELGLDDSTTKRWARHGSTRRLWNRDSVLKAIGYVIDGQGEPMSGSKWTAPAGRGSESKRSALFGRGKSILRIVGI